jgi:hypothetical protein
MENQDNTSFVIQTFIPALTAAPETAGFYRGLREGIARVETMEAADVAGENEMEKSSKVSFTEGPWNFHKAYPLEAAPFRVRNTDGIEYFTSWDTRIAKGETIIAEVQMKVMDDAAGGGWPQIKDIEEARANAQLLLAAPQLFAALEAAEQILKRSPNFSTNDSGNFRNISTVSVLAEVRAALALASGK